VILGLVGTIRELRLDAREIFGQPNNVVVCQCAVVSDRVVRAEIQAGALSADELAERCGAGARCGGCLETVERLLAECKTRTAA
jgi:bacterioferritin-associated ferredoxin